MAEYDIAFGEKLAEAARMVVAEDASTLEAQRTVTYLSLLSTEISLKAMLERAGKSVTDIRARSHRLAELLADLGRCEIEIEVSPGNRTYVPASRLRSRSLSHAEAESTIGAVIKE